MRRFNLMVPKQCMGVDRDILRPINCWPTKDEYKTAALSLAEKFAKNFERYADGVPRDVIEKGGPNLNF
jgi:phosphoenolpyruvate carboxykinase (ATP)